MLFDLRSRGRRHTVRVIYALLALIMLVGLVGLGVGTGTNNGGLLNLGGNGGGGGGATQAFNQQVNSAIKATKKDPSSSKAWASLLQARYGAAGSGSNYDSSTGVYTKSGKTQLRAAGQAWQKYLALTSNKPTLEYSFLAARIYQNLGQWSDEATAWQYAVVAEPAGSSSATAYTCLALSSYAGGNKSNGDLAATKAVQLTPKLQRLTLSSSFKSAKSSKTTAEETLLSDC